MLLLWSHGIIPVVSVPSVARAPNTTTYTLLLPVAFDRKLVSKDGECSGLFVCLLCG